MASPPVTDRSWIDIVPPDAPAQVSDPLTVAGGIVLLGLLLVLAWLLLRRPRQRARRTLRRIHRELPGSATGTRAAGFQVRRCLRAGFGHHRLEDLDPGSDHREQWRAFLDRLGRCCFSAQPPAVEELQAVVREAQQWLGRRPAPG
ncbi:MAG: hypothetical protein LJE84_00215 [Gammaproteobacteria bacterium]|nr:hypothetical protein [Gammaproteobacteria bacterium]